MQWMSWTQDNLAGGDTCKEYPAKEQTREKKPRGKLALTPPYDQFSNSCPGGALRPLMRCGGHIFRYLLIGNQLTLTLSFFFLINLFIYFWLSWVFVAVRGLSLVAASGGYSSLRCAGFSLRWLLLLRSTGSRHTGFSSCGTRALFVAHGLSCSAACGIFPDKGWNPCPLHWQVDS